MQIGKAASDLCSSSISQYFVSAYFESGPWKDYVGSLVEIYRRRRDVMLDALAEHFPREAEWTRPRGGLFIWATMPDYIDTTDLLARALRERVAFVPGRAAFMDGRGGASMRLNFSGVDESAIREGVRRIGEVIREQVTMYGTLTGRRPESEPGRRPGTEPGYGARPSEGTGSGAADPAEEELAPVLRLRARRGRAS
jgi:2-aminoadipate transaminase